MTIMFPAATLPALWRWLSLSPLPALRWVALALIMFTIVASNRDYEQHWRRHAGYLTETIEAFRAGTHPAGAAPAFLVAARRLGSPQGGASRAICGVRETYAVART